MLDPNAQSHFNARLRRTNVVPGVSPMAPQAPAGTGGFNMQSPRTSAAPPRGQQTGRTHSPGLNFQPANSPLGPSQGSPFMTGLPMPEGGPFGGGGPRPIPDSTPRQVDYEPRPQGFEAFNPRQVDYEPRPQGGEVFNPRTVDFEPRPYGGATTGPLTSPANPAGRFDTGGFNMQYGNAATEAPGEDMWSKLKRPMQQNYQWNGWNL